MKKNNDKKQDHMEPFRHEGHTLRTRRDFIAQGFLGGLAYTIAPTLGALLTSSNAMASVCQTPDIAAGPTPVFIIDLVGGGSIAGSNVIVGGPGGQEDFLNSYVNLGLPPSFHPSKSGMVNDEMGLKFHSDSGILRGIQSVTSAQTRMNSDGVVFCTSTDDDTENNQLNPMYWINKAGAKGRLNQLAGTMPTVTGGRTRAPAESINPKISPVQVASPEDAINLVGLGFEFRDFTKPQINTLMDSIGRMSEGKLNSISRRSLPDAIKALVGCSYTETQAQASKFPQEMLSPQADPVVTSIMNRITDAADRRNVSGMAKLVIDGFVGVGTIALANYDYHNGDRATGEIQDFKAGQVIGCLLELAAQKQKDVIIYVITDGSVSGKEQEDSSPEGRGKYIWTGDASQRSSSLMLVYKNDGSPVLRNKDYRQIGHFKPDGSVNNSAMMTSNSPVNLSKIMVANYLALHGEEGRLAEIVGDDPFRQNLDKYLVFNKLR